MKPPQAHACVFLISSAESAEAPAFAKAMAGPPFAFILGLTPKVFREGG